MNYTKGSAAIWIVAVIVLVVIGGMFAFRNRAEAPTDKGNEPGASPDGFVDDTVGIPVDENGVPLLDTPLPETSDEPPPQEPSPKGPLQQHVVIYTDNGYEPETLAIKQNESVKFINESSGVMWPASNDHPTHTLYPGSAKAKCDTPEEEGIFDACRDIAPGGSWEFVFAEIGTWSYHDHKDPSEAGTIAVTAESGL